jgi:hypothetical protein
MQHTLECLGEYHREPSPRKRQQYLNQSLHLPTLQTKSLLPLQTQTHRDHRQLHVRTNVNGIDREYIWIVPSVGEMRIRLLLQMMMESSRRRWEALRLFGGRLMDLLPLCYLRLRRVGLEDGLGRSRSISLR